MKPETVVLEMCQDRYDHWFYDAISHPNYDRTLSDIHKILEEFEHGLHLLWNTFLSLSTNHTFGGSP